MQDVAIVGAGELGGMLARRLAVRDIVRNVRLVDDSGSVAAGKALDIVQSAPIEPFATGVTGSADLGSTSGASLVVLADGSGGEWSGDEGLLLLKRLMPPGTGAVVLCAG